MSYQANYRRLVHFQCVLGAGEPDLPHYDFFTMFLLGIWLATATNILRDP